MRGVTPDFSSLFFSTGNAIDPNDQNSSLDVYAFHVPDRSTSWISQNGALESAPVPSTYVGSSADGTHVLFDTTQQLTTGDSARLAGRALYDRSGGQTTLVGVKTNGAPTSACGATIGDVGVNFAPPEASNAVAADGSRIFFESPDPAGSGDPSCSPAKGGTQPVELYLRADASTTTEISVSQRTGSVGIPAPGGATFQGATPDGSQVFFTSPDQLTDDAASASAREENLYRYDVGSGALTFIVRGTRNVNTLSVVYTDSIGDPLISGDGSQVYFTGSVPGNGPAGINLYLWNASQISFISPNPEHVASGGTPLEAHLSGDGLTLAFTAANNLTGFDSHGHYEVYLYRATTGTLSCISCDPNGGAPIDNATFFGNGDLASNLVSQNVSNDGRRVFFASADALLPQATNGLYNVYEYEDGVLRLLNDGNGSDQAWLVGASADGRDVIFATNASLVPGDRDGGDADFYDARIGGGFPYVPPAAGCGGDSCQGGPSVAATLLSPSSVSFPAGEAFAPLAAKPAAKQLTRAQKLTHALKACRAKHNKHKRRGCEAQARKKYGSTRKASHSNHRRAR